MPPSDEGGGCGEATDGGRENSYSIATLLQMQKTLKL